MSFSKASWNSTGKGAAPLIAQLDADDIALLGGPFSTAQVYQDFECLVGDDGLNFEDVVATRSHAVITPTGLAIVSCQAPTPATEAPPGFGPVDIDLLEEGELPGEKGEELDSVLSNLKKRP